MILGLDPGERRIGVAVADERTRFARPLEVIDRQAVDVVARIGEIVAEHAVEKVVVGRPVGLSGSAGPAVERHRPFVEELRRMLPVPVEEFDERLTTTIADQGLRAGGGRRRRRDQLRDAIAAQVMLQGYVDAAS